MRDIRHIELDKSLHHDFSAENSGSQSIIIERIKHIYSHTNTLNRTIEAIRSPWIRAGRLYGRTPLQGAREKLPTARTPADAEDATPERQEAPQGLEQAAMVFVTLKYIIIGDSGASICVLGREGFMGGEVLT